MLRNAGEWRNLREKCALRRKLDFHKYLTINEF
jgi:hypothetical protein